MTVIAQMRDLIRRLQADGMTLETISRATDGVLSAQHLSGWLRGKSTMSLRRFALLCEATGQVLGRPANERQIQDPTE